MANVMNVQLYAFPRYLGFWLYNGCRQIQAEIAKGQMPYKAASAAEILDSSS
jgi:hypothetical protein